MGTRNVTVIKSNGVFKCAQYGQWDGYPETTGVIVLHHLRKLNLNYLKEVVNKSEFVDDDYVEKTYNEFADCYHDNDIDEVFKEEYPEFSRDTGADIIDLIANTTDGLKLVDYSDFINDPMCAFAYVIDLDRMVLETYGKCLELPTLSNEDKVLKDFSINLYRVDNIDNLPSDDEYTKFFEVN
jgi:hypothetical protein